MKIQVDFDKYIKMLIENGETDVVRECLISGKYEDILVKTYIKYASEKEINSFIDSSFEDIVKSDYTLTLDFIKKAITKKITDKKITDAEAFQNIIEKHIGIMDIETVEFLYNRNDVFKNLILQYKNACRPDVFLHFSRQGIFKYDNEKMLAADIMDELKDCSIEEMCTIEDVYERIMALLYYRKFSKDDVSKIIDIINEETSKTKDEDEGRFMRDGVLEAIIPTQDVPDEYIAQCFKAWPELTIEHLKLDSIMPIEIKDFDTEEERQNLIKLLLFNEKTSKKYLKTYFAENIELGIKSLNLPITEAVLMSLK